MKKTLFTLLPLAELMAVVALLYGCSNLNARLAKEVTGVWQSTPEALADNAAISGSIVDTYQFGQTGVSAANSISGPVTVTGMVNVTTQVVSDTVGVAPTSLSASAHTTISGTWTVIDEDEISISLDPSTLSVDIDPEGVSMNTFGGSEAQLESITPALVESIKAGLKQALTMRYASVTHFDDIKVKGNLLKYEVNDEDFVLTRQSSAE